MKYEITATGLIVGPIIDVFTSKAASTNNPASQIAADIPTDTPLARGFRRITQRTRAAGIRPMRIVSMDLFRCLSSAGYPLYLAHRFHSMSMPISLARMGYGNGCRTGCKEGREGVQVPCFGARGGRWPSGLASTNWTLKRGFLAVFGGCLLNLWAALHVLGAIFRAWTLGKMGRNQMPWSQAPAPWICSRPVFSVSW